MGSEFKRLEMRNVISSQLILNINRPVMHGYTGHCQKQSLMLLWLCHQILSGYLANGHLPRVSRQSPLSASYEWKWSETGSCAQISWHLPYGWGKSWKTSARRPSDEDYATIHRLKWGILPPNVAGRFA